MSRPSLLAADFPPTSSEEWRRRVEEELGAAPFDKLRSKSPGGVVREPLYTAGDVAAKDPAGFPGLSRGWTVAQEYRGTPEDVAAAIRTDVAAGVQLVWLKRADYTREDLELLTGDLDLETVPLGGSRGGDSVPLGGSRGGDPVEVVLEKASADVAPALLLVDVAAGGSNGAPARRDLLIDVTPYHDGGADAVDELAFLAAIGVDVLRRTSVELASRGIAAFSVGGDFFLEIAKLRAARLLWSKVVHACGGSKDAQRLVIHARGSAVHQTVRDPWVNLLRGTSESFAAALGGADSIVTVPFDESLGTPEAASRRIAVNTQHVLREEAALDRVLDPAGGSYYLERLTDDLARAAWKLFQEIEGKGGMTRCLEDGWVRERLQTTAEKRRQDASRRKTSIVGVSDFANLDEELPERRPAEDSGAEDLPAFRLAADFEALRARADRWCEARGQHPRAFLAQLGAGADYRARAAFASSFLAAGGLETVDRGGSPADEVAAAFVESGAEMAVVCSTDEIYAEAVASAVPALKELGAPTVILAGRPGDHEASFREAGVDHFIFLGCDAVAVLSALWMSLEESR